MNHTPMVLALAGFSFMMTVIWGTPLLRILRYLKSAKKFASKAQSGISSKIRHSHMGGVLIISQCC